MPAADASGLFDESDMGKAAAIEFSGGGQACDAGADDADFMLRVSCLGDAVFLFYQCTIVKAQIRRIGKASRPFAFSRALCSGGLLGDV